MKALLHIPLFALLFAGVSSTAQEKTPPSPKDPFVKEKGGKEAEAGKPSDSHVNVGLVVQYIDVETERWRKWSSENILALDAGALRNEVEKWITAGDATLAESSLAMSKSGQRAKVESIRLQFYPHEFQGDAHGQHFPAAFECRNLGTTTEFDVMLTNDGAVDFNFAPERVIQAGEVALNEPGVSEGDVRNPLFKTQKVTTSVLLDPRQWSLLGCETSLDRPVTHRTLIFARPILHRFEEVAEGEAPAEGSIVFTWVEMDHAAFNASLMKDTDLSGWIGGGLMKEARAAGAKVVGEKILHFRSGQRSKAESLGEVRYPTIFDPPREDGGRAIPAAFETRNTGITAEIDPVISETGGVVDLNLSAEITSYHGQDVLHRVPVDGVWEPDITMAAFYTMNPMTQLSLPAATPVLVAVMSPPGEDGRTDSSRKVLLFGEFPR